MVVLKGKGVYGGIVKGTLHFYKKSELETILKKAKELDAEVYTTSKDFVKIPTYMQDKFKVLEIAVVWDEPEKLVSFIKEKINNV